MVLKRLNQDGIITFTDLLVNDKCMRYNNNIIKINNNVNIGLEYISLFDLYNKSDVLNLKSNINILVDNIGLLNDNSKHICLLNVNIKEQYYKHDYTELILNSDNYFNSEYRLKKTDILLLSYVKYTYDNKSYHIFIKSNDLNKVFDLINLNCYSMDLIRYFSFWNNQKEQLESEFKGIKEYYFYLFKSNQLDGKTKNQLIYEGNKVKEKIKDIEVKLNNFNVNKFNSDNIKNYIINSDNHYYNDLTACIDAVYKSFKGIYIKQIPKTLKDITIENSDYKYYSFISVDNAIIDYFNYYYLFDNNIKSEIEVIKGVLDRLNVLYEVLDGIESLKMDLRDLNKCYLEHLNNKLSVLNTPEQKMKDLLSISDEIKEILNKINEELNYYFKPFYGLNNNISNLNLFNIRMDLNKTFDYFDKKLSNEYKKSEMIHDVYPEDIFKSRMNHHNTIFKNSQNEFLNIAYNEKRNDFTTLE